MVSLRNNVNLIGRITKDIELSKAKSDISVCNFTIAVDRPGTNKDNRITDFFECVAWRGTAENICKYFHKGDQIGVHGNLQNDEFEDKEGNKRKKTEVQVDTFEFLQKKRTEEQGDTAANESVPEPVPVSTDNLPF